MYGTASCKFDGTGSHLIIAYNKIWDISNWDWPECTVEFWINPSSTSGTEYIPILYSPILYSSDAFGEYTDVRSYWGLFIIPSGVNQGKLYLEYYDRDFTWYNFSITSDTAISAGVWTHVAITRNIHTYHQLTND